MDLWKGKRRLRFEYRDFRGSKTERDLLLERVFEEGGAIYLRGYSFLREDERTFRLDRVIGGFVDAETGESAQLHELLSIPALDLTQISASKSNSTRNTATHRTSSGRASKRRKVKAPSGFVFPACNSSKGAAVVIRDDTDYRDEFLSYLEPEEKRSYDKEDFLSELDFGMLDISVQQFVDVIEVEPFKRLGFGLPNEVLSIFRNVVVGGDDEPIEINSPLKQKLMTKGLLEPVPMSDKAVARKILKGMLKPRLIEEGKLLGIKTSVKKDLLIETLLDNGENLSFAYAFPSSRMYRYLEKFAEAYLEDIQKTLGDLPDEYHAAVWEQVEMDDTLPESARAIASKRFSEREKQPNLPKTSSDFDTYTRTRTDGVTEIVITTDIDEKLQKAIEEAEEDETKPKNKAGAILFVLVIMFLLIVLALE